MRSCTRQSQTQMETAFVNPRIDIYIKNSDLAARRLICDQVLLVTQDGTYA